MASVIQKRFDRAATTYNHHCTMQLRIGEALLAMITHEASSYPQILDLGCGTGLNTQRLARRLPHQHITAMDVSEKSLAMAQQHNTFEAVTWLHHDFEQPFPTMPALDLVHANLALHWSRDLDATLRHCHQQLQPGGLIALSVPLADHFPELRPAYRGHWPHTHVWQQWLSNKGWALLAHERYQATLPFQSQRAVLQSLKATGTNAYSPKRGGLQARLRAQTYFVASDLCQLTWCVGLFLARRQPS